MLNILCAACRTKLWKYDKIGHGHVIRCHKQRIVRWYKAEQRGHKVYCRCGKPVGIDKGSHYRMISASFTHTGTKRNTG